MQKVRSLPPLLLSAFLLLHGVVAAGEDVPEDPASGDGGAGDPQADPAAAPAVEEAPPAAVEPPPVSVDGMASLAARVVCAGRVAAGLLVDDGRAVITMLRAVRLGYAAEVRLGGGHVTSGRIVAVDEDEGLALIGLEEPVPGAPGTPFRSGPPLLGDTVAFVGHGGATGLSDADQDLRELLTFSVVWARVAAAPASGAEIAPAGQPGSFLIDRSPGEGDEGSPLFDADGRVAGMLVEAVADSGGRAVVVSPAVLRDLAAERRMEKRWRRPHHLQSWAGFGIAAHNRPGHLAGTLLYGVRAVFLDSIRLETWLEADLGTRAARVGDPELADRPRDFWWSIETGLTAGYRIPMFVEGGRNYVVPVAGFRAGWNRFEHQVEQLATTCAEGEAADCGFVVQRYVDQERSMRLGIDVGLDVRHGPVRFGYRFFIDPANVQRHAMHRLLVTFDGGLLPIRLGDSN